MAVRSSAAREDAVSSLARLILAVAVLFESMNLLRLARSTRPAFALLGIVAPVPRARAGKEARPPVSSNSDVGAARRVAWRADGAARICAGRAENVENQETSASAGEPVHATEPNRTRHKDSASPPYPCPDVQARRAASGLASEQKQVFRDSLKEK